MTKASDWIDLIQGYENWRYDNPPFLFKTNEEGIITWFKCNGKQRIRVSDKYVTWYNDVDGQAEYKTWDVTKAPKDDFICLLDEMLEKLMHGRERREEKGRKA